MPTVLRSGPYRFYVYSHEPNEPLHVHVDRDDLSAKFWLTVLDRLPDEQLSLLPYRKLYSGFVTSKSLGSGTGTTVTW